LLTRDSRPETEMCRLKTLKLDQALESSMVSTTLLSGSEMLSKPLHTTQLVSDLSTLLTRDSRPATEMSSLML